MNKMIQEIEKHFIKVPTKPFVEIPLTIYWESSGPKYYYIVNQLPFSWERERATFSINLDYYANSYEAYATIPMLPLACLKGEESHILEKLSEEFITILNKESEHKPLTELICCSTEPTELDGDKSSFFVGIIVY